MTLSPISVAPDGWNFINARGQYVSPIGGNMLNDEHPGQGTLFQHFDEQDVERRFAAMAEVGLNCLRQAIGVNEVYDPDKDALKPAGMKNWDTFIRLADRYGVYLMPVGGYLRSNDWFDVEMLSDSGQALDESCAFWAKFVGHYAGHPAIWAWDLRNELLYTDRAHMTTPGQDPKQNKIRQRLLENWPAYLETRYGSVAAMNKAYAGYEKPFASFGDVPGSVDFEEQPGNPRAYDARAYLNHRGYHWAKRQCDVIRAACPSHMIVNGNNTWLSPDQNLWLANGFYNVEIHDLFDFVTHHPYPAWEATPGGRGDPLDGGEPREYWMNACVAMSRFDDYHKPMVLQEYGWYGGGESKFLCPLPHRSEEAFVDYMDELIRTLEPHTNGFINWPLMNMPASMDISNLGGIFTHDGKPRLLAKVYQSLSQRVQGRRLVRKAATMHRDVSLLDIYTRRGATDEFFDTAHADARAGHTVDYRFLR